MRRLPAQSASKPVNGCRLGSAALVLLLGMAILPASATHAAQAAPQRIVSVNLCSDIFALAFADRSQIASVSYISAGSPLSPVRKQAAGIRVNHSRIEEVLALQPDLVMASAYSNPQLTHWLRGQHIPLLTVNMASTLQQVVAEWQRVATRLGHPQRAQALTAQLQSLLAQRPQATRTVAVYGPGGLGVLPGSLIPALLHATGYQLLADLSPRATSRVDLELLLLGQPQVLLRMRDVDTANTLAARQARHPVLKQLQAQVIDLPSSLINCGGPELLDAVRRLEAH